MNIVFMGTPDYAKTILEALLNKGLNVNLVLTQPDRPVGRKKVLTPPPVKVLAKDSGIEVLQPQTLKDCQVQEQIKDAKPDIIIVAAFGQLLPKEVLNIAPCVNLHASILPEYRGASPIQQGLLNGDEYLGVSAMLMEEGLDTGDILGFRFVNRDEVATLDLAMNRLAVEAGKLTLSIIENFNKLNPIPQVNCMSSKCKKIRREDGLVSLDNALNVYRKYCAFFGWPGVFLENGLKLFGVEIVDINSQNRAGEILEVSKNGIKIGCKRGIISIKEVQPKSKSKMPAKAYLAGQRKGVGDTIL